MTLDRVESFKPCENTLHPFRKRINKDLVDNLLRSRNEDFLIANFLDLLSSCRKPELVFLLRPSPVLRIVERKVDNFLVHPRNFGIVFYKFEGFLLPLHPFSLHLLSPLFPYLSLLFLLDLFLFLFLHLFRFFLHHIPHIFFIFFILVLIILINSNNPVIWPFFFHRVVTQ